MKPIYSNGSDPPVLLTFHGDTADLLHRVPRGDKTIVYPLSRRASIKDILESLGVPHTEIGQIVLDGQAQTFDKIARKGEHFLIYPLLPDTLPTIATTLRPEPLRNCIFLVDTNIGRLAGLLRMAGFDAELVDSASANSATVERAIREQRILLTRNRDLLKIRRLIFGRLVRSQDPEQQLKEILDLYSLQDRLTPFSRCIACNGLLDGVEKNTIIDRLQPLTRKYYNRFKRCVGCGKIYWHGSHCDNMTAQLKRILGKTI
ncbi:hypothetical protein FCL47_04420 [Desulfopila sp. IMCC35006]|uniref:Mut7-C RNAse domain-containing protein n=1 Tax=Desulfopila sp. IMCC35006 TaxID=2569542 RepID=UPI0010AC94DA|nr:Mut7-C RNAse domain-containing protein [Desulfopila sp. IMCC35006]TKB27387.1 hypothetical protein FCL47_04420 [Desulfopila sp. IMCC35006]